MADETPEAPDTPDTAAPDAAPTTAAPRAAVADACRLCGGETAKATLKSGNHEAQVVIAGKPDGFLGVIPYTTSPVAVRVCRACGHIDLFARSLQDLLRIDAA